MFCVLWFNSAWLTVNFLPVFSVVRCLLQACCLVVACGCLCKRCVYSGRVESMVWSVRLCHNDSSWSVCVYIYISPVLHTVKVKMEFEPEEFMETVITRERLVKLDKARLWKMIEYLDLDVSNEARKPELVQAILLCCNEEERGKEEERQEHEQQQQKERQERELQREEERQEHERQREERERKRAQEKEKLELERAKLALTRQNQEDRGRFYVSTFLNVFPWCQNSTQRKLNHFSICLRKLLPSESGPKNTG